MFLVTTTMKHGVKAFCYPLSEEMQNKSVQEFLWEQDSLVDYIEKLSMILNGMDFATLLESFMYLKEYPKADAKVCLYDEKTHFVFAKRLMRKTDFSMYCLTRHKCAQ